MNRVNSDRSLRESSYADDSASVRVTLTWLGGVPRVRLAR